MLLRSPRRRRRPSLPPYAACVCTHSLFPAQGEIVTWGVNAVVYQLVFVDFFGWSAWGCVHCVLFELLIALIFTTHIRALTTDPGSVPGGTVRCV